MTGLDAATDKLLGEIAVLTVAERVALIHEWPGGQRPQLQIISRCMALLLARPSSGAEEAWVLAALVDGIRRTAPATRRALVKATFDARLTTTFAQRLLDAVAALIVVVDQETAEPTKHDGQAGP